MASDDLNDPAELASVLGSDPVRSKLKNLWPESFSLSAGSQTFPLAIPKFDFLRFKDFLYCFRVDQSAGHSKDSPLRISM